MMEMTPVSVGLSGSLKLPVRMRRKGTESPYKAVLSGVEAKSMARNANEEVLETWGGHTSFSYSGSVKAGTKIIYGKKKNSNVTAEEYRALLRQFRGSTVNMGTTRTFPPKGSVGDWLMANVTRSGIASYVGPILVAEGYAEKSDGPMIKFKS